MKKLIVNPLSLFLMTLIVSYPAYAAGGVDTATSSLTSLKSWIDQWVPILCLIALIISTVCWLTHLIQFNFAIKLIAGFIIIGSAPYILSWFNLNF